MFGYISMMAMESSAFSSLGQSNWNDNPKISVIPNIAIDSHFQGRGYFREMMEHCVNEAIEAQKEGRAPLLGLYVHPANRKAIEIYTRFGFEMFAQTYFDQASNTTYLAMIRRV